MELKGKLFFGIVGFFIGDLIPMQLGGLIGFVLGSIAGHLLFDKPKEENAAEGAHRDYQRRQGLFIFHVFRMCAKMAKSDGPVNNAEVKYMEYLMQSQFRMSDKGRAEAIRVWKQAKDGNDPFDKYATAFYTDFGPERYQVLNMMDLLFAMAATDGGLHPREEELLLRAAYVFHIGRLQYDRIKSRYYQSNTRPQARWSPLDPYYAILGAQPTEPLDAIKKKFRKLVLQWHPDKVVGQGASPDAVRHAKEKFQQINEAWEKITEARKR
jgi:DnaJ like chaperone protein